MRTNTCKNRTWRCWTTNEEHKGRISLTSGHNESVLLLWLKFVPGQKAWASHPLVSSSALFIWIRAQEFSSCTHAKLITTARYLWACMERGKTCLVAIVGQHLGERDGAAQFHACISGNVTWTEVSREEIILWNTIPSTLAAVKEEISLKKHLTKKLWLSSIFF